MKTEETTSTSNTTIYDVLVEVESPNIYIQTNVIHISNFKITNKNFHKMIFRLEIIPWF